MSARAVGHWTWCAGSMGWSRSLGSRSTPMNALDLTHLIRTATSRFPWRNLDVVREVEVTTTSLDAVAQKEGIGHIDFIKIDFEGAELEVLRGASRSLADRTVLCIKTEF